MLRACFNTQQAQKVGAGGVGRGLESKLGQQFFQCCVDSLLAHRLFEPVHGQSTFLVVDVTLVFYPVQGQLFHRLGTPAAQVAVQLSFQELADLLFAVQLFHYQQCGVLRERLRQQGHALFVGPNDLVRPPLVCNFVGGDVGHHIYFFVLIRIFEVLDKSQCFRVGHRVGKGLRKVGIGRKLQHPGLGELVGRERRAKHL